MKIFFSIIFILSFVTLPELSKIRQSYPQAAKNSEATQELYDALTSVSEDDNPILVAYKGGIFTLMAKYAKGIKSKKEYFKTGTSLIEKAIINKPKNIEIRCIRLGVQENSPKIMKYKNHIEEDKQFLLDHYNTISSKEVKIFVKNYVLQSALFDSAEKQLF